MTDPKERRKQLYEGLVRQHAYSGTEEEFEQKFSDEARIMKLYNGLKERNMIKTTSEDEFVQKFFGDVVKKKIYSFQDEMQDKFGSLYTQDSKEGGSTSMPSSSKGGALVVDIHSKKRDFYETDIKKVRSDVDPKDKLEQEARKKKHVEFYDKVAPLMDEGTDIRTVYKNWNAENGMVDRHNYLEEKARYEGKLKYEGLERTVDIVKRLQEDRRKAAHSGDMDEYSRLNDLIQSGVEELRKNKEAANEDYAKDPRTETGLMLWEESIGFTSQMLNDKMESLLANPDTKNKLTQLQSLNDQLKKKETPELIEQYNAILSEPDVAEINRLSKHGQKLVDAERELAYKFPHLLQERLDKKAKQENIDRMFKKGDKGLASGVMNQLGRSATGFIADLAKIPALFDYNNEYGWNDKWSGAVDSVVDYVNEETLPTPSDYSKPLTYEDEYGNRVWRTDLIVPKVARVGGDMAALIFGAGKFAKGAKVLGFSNKVSAGIGLFTSSYVQSFNDYKKAAEDAGMSPADAQWFATAASGTTSALELISPNKYLWAKQVDEVAKRVVKNIAAGVSKKEALKESFKFVAKEIGTENLQELTQQLGDLVVETGANKLTGNDYFEHNGEDIMNEALETMVLTSIVAGAPASVSRFAKSETYSDAIKIAAENKEKYLPLLQDAFRHAKIDPEKVRQVMGDINAIAVPEVGETVYKVNDIPVERSVIEEKIEAGDFEGIYVANDPQLEQTLQDKLNSDVKMTVRHLPIVAEKQFKELEKSGDIKVEGDDIKAKTVKGVDAINKILEQSPAYLESIPQKTKKETIVQSEALEQPIASDTPQVPPIDSPEGAQIPPATADVPDSTPSASEQIIQSSEPTAIEPEVQKRINRVLKKSVKSLAAIKPNLKIKLYLGAKEASAYLGKPVDEDSAGFYEAKSGLIGIDLTKADATTAFHESFHPIIDFVKEENPQLFKQLSKEAAGETLELADGSTTNYLDYTKGNKDEALVEFLSDYADGRFDELTNFITVVQAVKDFVSKVLESVGLKSSDFDVDLDNIEDLKDFAEQMAVAISKGKKIKFKAKERARAKTKPNKKTEAKTAFQRLGAKKKIKKYEKKSGKKVNQTAKRIATDRFTEFKQIATDVVTNPDQYAYDPQKFSDIDDFLEKQSDLDLFNMLSINNSMSVLAGIKLLRRYNKNNQDTRPVFKKLREIGTSVGQLLRQFGELKNHTPEGIVQLVLKNLESMNLTLTNQQVKDLQKLADDHHQALNDQEAKREAFNKAPSDQAKKDLDDADTKLAKTFEDLNKFIGKVTPMGVDSMLATVLQGNLLTPKSIVTNVLGNLIQQPLRQIELAAGDLATYMVYRFKGVNMINPVEIYFGAGLNGLQQSVLGVGRGVKDAVKGRGAETTSSLEVRRNLKPLQAWWQILSKAGRASLPVNAKGKVPASVYLEKMIEGTSGVPAEVMFRLLYAGDKPFRDGAKIAGAYRLFAESGGKSSTDFRRFMANLKPEQKAKIQEYANEATFSNERLLAKNADRFIHWTNSFIESIAEKAPEGIFKETVRVVGKVLTKSVTPFVRVPSNLLQYLIELALPVIPLVSSINYARQGDPRKSAQMFVRAATGFALMYLADMLYDAGVVLASGEDDEENERQLKHEVGRPNGINISAYARFRSGIQDPDNPWQVGDKVIDFSKLGLFGMYMAYRAEFNESVKKELKQTRAELSIGTRIAEQFNSVLGASLEMSFMQGSYNMLKSIDKGGFQEGLAELGNTMTAIVIPNTVSAVTRARAPYILRADDKEALTSFFEKQSTKIHPNLKDNVAGVYPIISMFGEPAHQTPTGANPIIYHFFDIANGEKIQDPLAVEVFNVSKKVGKIPMSMPTARVKLDDIDYTLTEGDYTYLQMMAGKYKQVVLQEEMLTEEWKTYTPEEKAMIMDEVNEEANSAARDFMVEYLYTAKEEGRIVVDEKMGTYKYTSPGEFDFDFTKRFLEEE